MKKSLKGLLEGSPSKFFDDIKASLNEKVSEVAAVVAEDVAPSVFEEVEQLDELSKGTLRGYVKKAAKSLDHHAGQEGYNDAKRIAGTGGTNKEYYAKNAKKRVKGLEMAADKLTREEVEPVAEDMGARTIYTNNKKQGRTVSTFVVNKRRQFKADKDRKWSDLIKKAQPKETVWDKHVKEDVEQLDEQDGYIAFYNGRRMEIYANTQLEAKEKAVAAFKAPKGKRHMVHVHLAEKDGKQVTHSTQFV